MKARKLLILMIAVFLLIGTGCYWFFFGGPYSFVEIPLSEESLLHLKSAVSAAPQLNTPENMADEYLHGLCDPSDRPKRSDLDIAVSEDREESTVTIIDWDCKDDSIHVSCSRIILQRKNGLWLPIKHQAAWQGRGQIGWTTRPCS